jgi:hypothetical protein
MSPLASLRLQATSHPTQATLHASSRRAYTYAQAGLRPALPQNGFYSRGLGLP